MISRWKNHFLRSHKNNFFRHNKFALKLPEGSKYPKAKFVQRQSLPAKITAVSDIYDALRSRRSYKQSMRLEKVFEIMQNYSEQELNTKIKSELLQVLTQTVYFKEEKSPLMVGLQKTASSLQQCYLGERKKINYPKLWN